MIMKSCKNPNCSQINPQPISAFYNEKSGTDGKRRECKACRNTKINEKRRLNPPVYNGYMARWCKLNPERQHATDIKRNYGLSIENYNKMLTEQACMCKICGKQHAPSIKRGRLYVDHNKETKEIRGLLCGQCNSGIGYLKHDILIMQKAIDYLTKLNNKGDSNGHLASSKKREAKKRAK